MIEPSSAQAMGTSAASMTGGVSWKPKLAPAVSGFFGGRRSSPNIEDGIAYVGAVGVWARRRLSQRRDDARRSGQHCAYGQMPSAAAQWVLTLFFHLGLGVAGWHVQALASRIATQTFNLIASMSAFENVELP